MRSLIQRVSEAHIKVEGEIVAQIGIGVLVMVGFKVGDEVADWQWSLKKILGLRIFPDAKKPMNVSLQDINGGLLLVPQFTLNATVDRGMRPGFASAEVPPVAEQLFANLLQEARQQYADTHSGVFGANMQVALINDGPATFILDSRTDRKQK